MEKMRNLINQALDQLDALYLPGNQPPVKAELLPLLATLQQIHEAHVDIIQQAVSSLMKDQVKESHDLLQHQRNELESTLARIANLIEEISKTGQPLNKLVIEYLHTRTRLVDDVRMFPEYVLVLLETLTLDESLAATISQMEFAMTGKRGLFQNIQALINDSLPLD